MADKLETEFARDALLKRLDFGIRKLDHTAALDVDEMIVMLARRRFEASAAVAEFVPFENAFRGKQFERAINGRKRNSSIDRMGAPIHSSTSG